MKGCLCSKIQTEINSLAGQPLTLALTHKAIGASLQLGSVRVYLIYLLANTADPDQIATEEQFDIGLQNVLIQAVQMFRLGMVVTVCQYFLLIFYGIILQTPANYSNCPKYQDTLTQLQ